jgi:hypothetical protein
MNKVTSVEDHKLTTAYESLRETFRSSKYSDRVDKPLAFWALPGDRRLPMALLGHPIKDLITHPLEELAATPGIGKKKLHSLIKLLHRATRELPPAVPQFDEDTPTSRQGRDKRGRVDFDPAVVSEVLWEQWRNTVRRYGLDHETLGRLAPSMERLPTVIWRLPLSDYMDMTIAEIRRLKTHGEKRVRAILEVFHSVHEMLARVPHHGHLRIDVRPKFIAPIEQWIEKALKRSEPPSANELKQRLLLPLLEQLRIDAGPELYRLVEERLGVRTSPYAVQQQAKRLGVTRARIYQLLEMCGEIMSVRWPEGDELLRRLGQKLASFPNAKTQISQLRAVRDLVYPRSDRSAASNQAALHPQSNERPDPLVGSRSGSAVHTHHGNGADRVGSNSAASVKR